MGLWLLLHLGLWNMIAMIVSRAGDYPEHQQGDNALSFVMGVVFSFVGVLLLRNPSLVVDFAFNQEAPPDPSDGGEQEPPRTKQGE